MSKSTHHQSHNDFRFQTFAERIAAVSIDVVHKIKHHDEELEEQSTYFGEALLNWNDLNCTEHFNNFQQEISEKVHTFPQLVHNEVSIVEALKKHLLVPKSLAYEPLLDLVVQLARDLQADFYKYFHDFFNLLVKLLASNSQDVDILEKIFSCLAYLFKFLWRYLAKDVKEVYGIFSALLGSRYKDYIRKFAAESFAFLMRKVKDHGAFFDFLFSTLEEHPDKAEGVGQLLFEMMKGVKKQFHSSAVQIFPVMLSKLGPCDSAVVLPWELVEQSLCQMMRCCAEHTNKEFLAPMWNILLDCLGDLQKVCVKVKGQKQKVKAEQLCRLLRVSSVWLDHHQGALVCDANQVAEVFTQIMKTSVQPEILGPPLLAVVSSLLVNLSDRLTMGITAKILGQVYTRKFPLKALGIFTKSTYDLFLFEKDVLPNLLSYIQSQISTGSAETKDILLALVTHLVLHKVSIPADGSQQAHFNKIRLDFTTTGKGAKKGTFQQYLLSLLDFTDTSLTDTSTLSALWAALVCLPHCSPMDNTLVERVQRIWSLLVDKTQISDTDKATQDNLLFVMEQVVLTMILLNEDSQIHSWLCFTDLLELLRKSPSNLNILKMVNLYLSQCSTDHKDDILTPYCLLELLPLLQLNLASWSSQVRLLSVHSLSLFPVKLPELEEKAVEQFGVIDICLSAERKPADVYNYRDRLRYLQKLDHELVQPNIPIGPFEKIPLYYLIGSLYINFKLLWEPVRKLIQSYAVGMTQDVFWSVQLEHLKQAACNAENNSHQHKRATKEKGDTCLTDEVTAVCEMYHSCHGHQTDGMESPDHVNFRLQLWRALELFPDKCEERGKEVVPVFLKFFSDEYNQRDMNSASSEDISVTHSPVDQSEFEDEEEEEDEETKDGTQESKKKKHLKKKKKRKGLIPTLLAHLNVFSKFKKPKSLYKEPELRKIYHELLHHKDISVQKAAFSCILTYNHKYITPYKENFLRLLEDKTFKEELVAFSIDRDNTQIKEQHRQNLLPVLMGILYGRMQSRIGKDTTGKAKSNVRRAVVFRFLAGCSSLELKVFLDLVFEPLLHFVSNDPVAMVKDVEEKVDVENIFPVRRMGGILSTALMVVQKLRHLMDEFLPSLIQILLGLAATCTACLNQRDQLKSGAIAGLKNVRQTVVLTFVEVFEEFDKYAFTDLEIQAVFDAVVRPQLARLPHEGIYAPTPLLKLISVWTRHLRYYHLLSIPSRDDKELTPLAAVFSLLNAKGCTASVSNLILEMVDNLLSLEESEEGETMLNALSASDKEKFLACKQGTQECGVRLLQPYLPSILLFLKKTVETMGSGHMSKKQSFATELKMLAKVSSLVKSDDQCSLLCSMLFPFLDQKVKRTREMEENILNSIVNLTKVLESPKQFFRPVSKLFSVICNRQSRVYLCVIFKIIGEKCPQYRDIATVVEKLNAWNPRRSEEPDYNTRLAAFNEFNQSLRDMDRLDMEALLPVMHNCYHFILKVDDLSLRDNSTYCLVTMVTQLSKTEFDQDLFREVITQGILPMVKSGLYDKSETVRHEFLTIFGVLVKAFPDNPTFDGLTGLTDSDIDNDFYENIKHIQVHRRVKAMRKLITYLETTHVRRELLTSYFLPLTSMVTLDPAYLKIQGLREVAIDLLAVLCKLLPWQQYLHQLRFYLSLLPKKLENQKLYVRVIVAVLNSFHFDISKTELATSNAPKVVQEAEEQVGQQGESDATSDSKAEEETSTIGPDQSVDDETSNKSASHLQEIQLTKEGRQLCSPGLATKIHVYVLKTLIPELHKLLTQKINREEEHKSVRSKFTDDHEILRVPIALAMIKLLQTLPRGMLQQKLPGILMKVCNFLKSRSREVRETSRDTLVRISQSLGLRYFNFIVKEMRDALTKGYQLHVLGFSVNRLLINMESHLKPGDLDPALHNLSEVFKEELFGTVSEEKDVEGITKKLMEARETKSYDSYGIVAKYVGVGSVNRLISPLRDLLMTARNKKTAQKIEEVFRRITNGLMENTDISTETMMILIHELIISNIEDLEEKKKDKEEKTDRAASNGSHRPQSCLLLTKAPPRGGDKPKSHLKTNMHLLVEFGFQLLHMCLRRSRLLPSTDQHLQLLDPLVEALSHCLYSKHVKENAYKSPKEDVYSIDLKPLQVNSLALRCMSFLLRFPLPSLKNQITKITQGMFLLLKNYASAGAGKGENLELVVTCFKAMTVLVRDVQFYQVDRDQLQVLLTFCEEDLLDYTRQSTGFNLLKAILSRKLKVKELHDLMEKVREMSITESSSHVRLQCRQVFLQYLLDYPHKNKTLATHMEYYVTQLTYELEHGRISALEMLATIFSNFPMKVLIQHSGLFFVPMAASLINDDSQKCRKLTSLAIKTLLEKIDVPTRDVLFSIVSNWMKETKVTHRTLAYQVCGVFVEVEENSFERRLLDILPLIQQQADPDRYVEKEEDREFEVDHCLFSLLTAVSKIVANCQVVRNPKYTYEMNVLWDHIHHHLLYPHAWCRLTACQLFGQLFAAWPLDDVKKSLQASHSSEYLLSNTREKIRNLSQSFITQLQSELLTEDLVNQIVKNMLYIGKIVKILPAHGEHDDEDGDTEGSHKGPSIKWLIKHMVREANYEAVNNPKVTIRRAGIFKWLAAVCLEQEKSVIQDVLRVILSALNREMTSQTTADSDLKTLAQEVMDLLKKLVGVESFSQVYSQIQQTKAEKRAGKKRQRAAEAVSRPEVAAKRKMKKYEVRKESKKRKIQMLKTGKTPKKLKLKNMAILNDD